MRITNDVNTDADRVDLEEHESLINAAGRE
jgi:hypothetical protein